MEKMLLFRKRLVRRIALCCILMYCLWQWIMYSANFGKDPHEVLEKSDQSFDQLFHKGMHDHKLQREIAEILQSPDEAAPNISHHHGFSKERQVANLTFDLSGLDTKFGEDWHWKWISLRIHQLWPELCAAARNLKLQYPKSLANRTRLKVLVLPGVLSLTDFAHPGRAFHGGPLGELTQWSDVIAALYLLGHELQLRWDVRYAGIDLTLMSAEAESSSVGCAVDSLDVIYTDLTGHSNLPELVRHRFRNKFRILDAFGTEPAFNNAPFARKHGLDRGAGMRDLHTRQFFTMYPQVPDNSFAGFIVSSNLTRKTDKQEIGVIYGKEANYMRGKESFLERLASHIELHMTMPQVGNSQLLAGVVNHGVVSTQEYRHIVDHAKYFIGLGHPVEGPGMLEALARGCIIIQPAFTPPLVLSGKPNNRALTSQVPYLEDIGSPHVYTFSYQNLSRLEEILNDTKQFKVKPLLPKEFTALGYLLRLNAYLQRQKYCAEKSRWPPDRVLDLRVSKVAAQSCTDVCRTHGLVCEHNHFDLINTASVFNMLNLPCSATLNVDDVNAPYVQTVGQLCYLQNNTALFSCASYFAGETTNSTVFRVCPCRTFMKEQHALCQTCW